MSISNKFQHYKKRLLLYKSPLIGTSLQNNKNIFGTKNNNLNVNYSLKFKLLNTQIRYLN